MTCGDVSQPKERGLGRHERIRAAFVTNICPHYRVQTFETLSRKLAVEFLFYSAGNERYWQQSHGVRAGHFPHTYLRGVQFGQSMRVVPSLPTKLWKENYDVIVKCINGRFALPVTYITARLTRKPFVLWTGIWMSLETRFHRLVFPLTRWIYRHADAIVVYGEHVKRYLVDLNVAPEKIFVAAHAVDNSQYNRAISESKQTALKVKLGLRSEKIVLYLGRLEEEKGVDYLIRAFGRLNPSDAVLLVVGDGSVRENLKALVREHNIEDKTRFIGYISPEETLTYYAIADLFVLPSVTMPTGKEPWGLVVNEAMNQGLPVIATDAVGAAAGGLIQAGVNGFIVPERNSEALATAIERILVNRDLRDNMRQNACRIIAGWDNERMVQGFEQAIHYVLRTKSVRARDLPEFPFI
jgi:glycosyltransferase involved in cell wall biosynthesis